MATPLEDMRQFFIAQIDQQQEEITQETRTELDPVEAFDNTTTEFVNNIEADNILSQDELSRIADPADQDSFGFFGAKNRLNKKIYEQNFVVESTEVPNEFIKRFVYNLFVVR